MVQFVICGIADCRSFAHVCYVASYLEKHLPHILVTKKVLAKLEYCHWLDDKNKLHGWHHDGSPISYKKLTVDGQPYLIGGVCDFLEYCHDYYGIEIVPPAQVLEKIIQDNVALYARRQQDDVDLESNDLIRKVCIYGAAHPMVRMLIPEMIKVEGLSLPAGIFFLLFDDSYSEVNNDIFDDLQNSLRNDWGYNSKIIVAIHEAISYCDLLVITEDMIPTGDSKLFYKKVLANMNRLAIEINVFSKKDMKVVFANYGLSCFAATVLSNICYHQNVTVVTSDLGLSYLSMTSKLIDVPLANLGGPPVWGFIDNNEIVDINGILEKCEIIKPFRRSLRNTAGSSLASGTVVTELRFLKYLTDDCEEIYSEVKLNKKLIRESVKRPAWLHKISATVSLLKIWFSGENSSKVISLGVRSDGSYGLPTNIVFSQPAILIDNNWKPFSDYPVEADVRDAIEEAAEEATIIMNDFDVLP